MKAQSLADYEFPTGREWHGSSAAATVDRAASKPA
jgi:hypothetical protein